MTLRTISQTETTKHNHLMTLRTIYQPETTKHGVPRGSMLGPLMLHNIHKSPSSTNIPDQNT